MEKVNFFAKCYALVNKGQIWWAAFHYAWARAIAVTGTDRHRVHVPEGKKLIRMGASKFVNS